MFYPLDGVPRRVEAVHPTEEERLYDFQVSSGEMLTPSKMHVVIHAYEATEEITCCCYIGPQKVWRDYRDDDLK